MRSNDIAYAMIKSAVEKGVHEIQENPQRGIRKLVDLGDMFADGRFQKQFFSVAKGALTDPDSMYYQLVERLATGTQERFLTAFGMNLGYNAWTKGAGTIRRIEAEMGHNIPWCLILEMGDGSYLAPQTTAGIISQGRALGIYAYLLFVDETYQDLDGLLELIGRESDCAMALFLAPGLLDEKAADRLTGLLNVCAVVDLCGDAEALRQAAQRLHARKCLAAGYALYDDFGADASRFMERCDGLGLPFLMMYKDGITAPEAQVTAGQLARLRDHLTCPVLPIELSLDLLRIDQNISTEACMTCIRSDGAVTMTSAEHGWIRTGHHIEKAPLAGIFSKMLPKQGHVSD